MVVVVDGCTHSRHGCRAMSAVGIGFGGGGVAGGRRARVRGRRGWWPSHPEVVVWPDWSFFAYGARTHAFTRVKR